MTSLQMIISKLEDQDLPIIGKFEESINLTKATQPVKMYWYDEEILEEPFDLDVKDFKDFAKKKRMRRRAMRYNKSKLILEDSSTNIRDNNHLKYEGRVTNMGTSETTKSDARFKYGASSSLEADFKYVTLQPQKVVVDGKEITQIVVCPVGDFYLFRKVATGEQQFLSAVDDAFDAKIKHDHAKLDRYKAISKALSRDSERSRSGDVKDNDESNRLDIPFGRHAAMGGRVNARSKLKKYVEGDTDVGVSGMDSEAVADFDGEAEFDAICGGDYEKVYADDEEEHVLAEQAQMEQREDTLAGQEVLGDDEGMTQDEHGNVIDDDIEDDNDVYIDVEYEDDDEPKSSDLRLSLSKPGMVNFDMERVSVLSLLSGLALTAVIC